MIVSFTLIFSLLACVLYVAPLKLASLDSFGLLFNCTIQFALWITFLWHNSVTAYHLYSYVEGFLKIYLYFFVTLVSYNLFFFLSHHSLIIFLIVDRVQIQFGLPKIKYVSIKTTPLVLHVFQVANHELKRKKKKCSVTKI